MNQQNQALKRVCSVLLAMALMMLAPASALAEYKAVVTASTRVYAAASTKAASVKLSKGTIVTVEDTANGVAKISNKGNVGYVDLSDLSKLKSTTVAVSGAKVYQSASAKAKAVSIKKGTKVNVVSTSGNWAKIERSGNTGYMRKALLEMYYEPEDIQELEESTEGMTRVEKVIAAAKTRVGCPYVYAASGPNSFDCAGLVRHAYKTIGVSLTHSAYGQGYNEGEKVSYDELEAGDIVCFNTNDTDGDLVDHTGIYLGDGKFIHASSARAEVIISSLSSGYYKRVFSWGRRVI